jgi:nucleoside-diphosphate-sugar epimerase
MSSHDTVPTLILAGATGDLGLRIGKALCTHPAKVVALVRQQTTSKAMDVLHGLGVEVRIVDYNDVAQLADTCRGAHCVISVLAGLQEVILEAQGNLLAAAVKAHVPRFIPSDFSLDFFGLDPNSNRNLGLRHLFAERLAQAPIQATSILNGAFTEMLTGPAPILFNRLRRVVYWENADVQMDFTTMDDVAAFTALAALDAEAPRVLRIAGGERSARDLAHDAAPEGAKPYKLLRAGSLGTLERIMTLTRKFSRQSDALYPPWQGMQYLHNMYSGRGKLKPLDNNRYGPRSWTTVREFLATASTTKT